MIITRELINPDIIYKDYKKDDNFISFTYKDLIALIDSYKNLLLSKGAEKGHKIVIGNQANVSQIAMVFACAELGLNIIIIGDPLPPTVKIEDYTFGSINEKFKLMLPVNFFITENKTEIDKFQLFKDICKSTIIVNDEILDFTPNNTIHADENTFLITCTSSGTTGLPKVIKHTHNFLGQLILRNSKQFYGKMGMLTNLAHGSSIAVYFLPGLLSNNTTEYINLPNRGPITLLEISSILEKHNLKLDHILSPYSFYIDNLVNSNKSIKGCVLHTLGIIKKEWLTLLRQERVKDIISIFGTNETSGPFMLNKASDPNFTEESYSVPDNFYTLNLNLQNELEVGVPVYNTVLKTNDVFLKINDKFLHKGRSQLYRINDLEINVDRFQTEIDKLMKANLIIDTAKDSIYLALWEDTDDLNIRNINNLLRYCSDGLHFIHKCAKLNLVDYLNGVKIDQKMIRDFFRDHKSYYK
jgi:hypothetical protein